MNFNNKIFSFVLTITLLICISIAFNFAQVPDFNVILFFKLLGMILLGPLSGWYFSIVDRKIFDAFLLLSLSTLLSIGPIIIFYIKDNYKKIWLIYFGLFFWICSGLLFTIGIWI